MELAGFPGGSLIQRGLADLAAGRESEAALLLRYNAWIRVLVSRARRKNFSEESS